MEKTPPTEGITASAPKAAPLEWSVTAVIGYLDVEEEFDEADEEGHRPPPLREIESVHFVIDGPALKAKAGYYGVAHTTADEWMGLLKCCGITFLATHGTIAVHSRCETPHEPRGTSRKLRPAVITFEVSRFGGHCDGSLYVEVPLEACRAAIITIAEAARAIELAKAAK